MWVDMSIKRNLPSSPATQTTEKNTKHNEIIDPLRNKLNKSDDYFSALWMFDYK